MILSYNKNTMIDNREEKFGWDMKVQQAVHNVNKSHFMTVPPNPSGEVHFNSELPANKKQEMPYKSVVANFSNSDYEIKLKQHGLKLEDLNPAPKVKYQAMPKLVGKNIISMSLYGSNLRYTVGAIKNAEMIKENFPGWKLRIYTEGPPKNPKFGIVPQTVIDRLQFLGAEIYYVGSDEKLTPPMMWRFLVADDDSVDRFIVRDSDARLSKRDSAAVYAWVQSNKTFHCVRDHPSHKNYPISGGMWGSKARELKQILPKTWRNMTLGLHNRYLDDMNFLNNYIWPKVQNHTYCSDSVSCDKYPNSHPFPVPRYGYEHVGQVVIEHELGRQGDVLILKRTGENKKCVP
jgi:hypothetical protein